MSDQQMIFCAGASHDPMTLNRIMELPPGIYIGTTPEGKRAVIKVSRKEPVVNMQVVVGNGRVRETQFYSDHTIHEAERQIHI